MKKKNTIIRDINPQQEEIVQQVADFIADYKLGKPDNRTRDQISDTFFNYLLQKLDFYCQ